MKASKLNIGEKAFLAGKDDADEVQVTIVAVNDKTYRVKLETGEEKEVLHRELARGWSF